MAKKLLISVISLIIIAFVIVVIVFNEQEYTSNLFYMDTYISVKVLTSKYKSNVILNDIDKIFNKYENMTNRYSDSELSKINNKVGTFEISNELSDMIKISLEWYNKSNGLFNINIGNIVDVWKKYRTNKNGVPTVDELNLDINIDNISLYGNKITVKNANIDLGALVKGYVTNELKSYLKSKNIKKYVINAGGNVIVGNKKNDYKIGIQNPDGGLLTTVNVNNKCVVTSGGYERYYEYNGVRYHHIINPFTKFPSNYMKSVTVISKDCTKADIMSTTLFLMTIEDGKKLAESNNVKVIWYSNDNEIIEENYE